jgi:hypothetical protein
MAPVALPVVIPGIAMAYSRNPFMDILPFINTDRLW